MIRTILYIAACVIIPALWGLVVSILYDRLAARRASTSKDDDSVEMYHI